MKRSDSEDEDNLPLKFLIPSGSEVKIKTEDDSLQLENMSETGPPENCENVMKGLFYSSDSSDDEGIPDLTKSPEELIFPVGKSLKN